MTLPEGYLAHDGGACPVAPEQYVDCIIRTGDGLGHSGVSRAKLHEWLTSEHPDGFGAIVGYRLAMRGEKLPEGKLHERWDEGA